MAFRRSKNNWMFIKFKFCFKLIQTELSLCYFIKDIFINVVNSKKFEKDN